MSDLLLRATAAEERAEHLEREMHRLRTALEKIRFTEGIPRGVERIAIAALKRPEGKV